MEQYRPGEHVTAIQREESIRERWGGGGLNQMTTNIIGFFQYYIPIRGTGTHTLTWI
jgi:hypothetical protein